MFNKQARPPGPGGIADFAAPAEPPALRKGPRVASIIATDISVEGNLKGDGEVQIDGKLTGDVVAARLAVGESGLIEGAIEADSVEIRGRVVGSVKARQVRLHATAHVEGDIAHDQLTIEAGAYFEGRSQRLRREPAHADAPAAEVIDISSVG